MRIQFPLLPREIEEVCRLCPGFRGDPSSLEDVKKFVLFYFLSARFNNMLDHHVVVYNDDICFLRFWLQKHPFIFTLPQIFSFPIYSQKCKIVRRNTSKHLYHHFTVAIDTNNIRIVFKVFHFLFCHFMQRSLSQDVKDSILKKNLDALLLQ